MLNAYDLPIDYKYVYNKTSMEITDIIDNETLHIVPNMKKTSYSELQEILFGQTSNSSADLVGKITQIM